MVLVDIHQDTLGRLNKFVEVHNLCNPNKLGNEDDAIDFLIQTVDFFQSVCVEGNLLEFSKEEMESMDIDPKYKEFLKKNSKI